MRMVVDLPAPLGPRKPTTWPRSIAKETWSTAVTPSNRLETPSTERKGIGAKMLISHPGVLQPPGERLVPYSDLRKAVRAARTAAGSPWNRSRAAADRAALTAFLKSL